MSKRTKRAEELPEETIANVYYNANGDFLAITCAEHGPKWEREHPNDWNDFDEATAVYSTGAENEVYCAICGKRIDQRRI